jgi:hypothetical protein
MGYCAGGGRYVGLGTMAADGATFTRTSGDAFQSWPAGTMISITGASFSNGGPSGHVSGRIASVVGNVVTFVNASANVSFSGAQWRIGSEWDGNSDSATTKLGYPCLDQPGRGKGQLLVNYNPPNGTGKLNNSTGTMAWPNQLLEPIYTWMLSAVPHPGHSGGVTDMYAITTASGGRVVAGRDLYRQASAAQTSATSPFDGTTTDATAGAGMGGVGYGVIAFRPTTCTTGTAYWATNEGSWNQSTSNSYGVQRNGQDGKLYICTATDTWTAKYGAGATTGTAGEPYTYPHPLRTP